jgi:hypothetical protein
MLHIDPVPRLQSDPVRHEIHGLGNTVPVPASDDEVAPVDLFRMPGGGEERRGRILRIDVVTQLVPRFIYGKGLPTQCLADHQVQDPPVGTTAFRSRPVDIGKTQDRAADASLPNVILQVLFRHRFMQVVNGLRVFRVRLIHRQPAWNSANRNRAGEDYVRVRSPFPATFQQIQHRQDVGGQVGGRILVREIGAGLGGEVEHDIDIRRHLFPCRGDPDVASHFHQFGRTRR